MIEYDILASGPNPPSFAFNGTLIRCVYTPHGPISGLVGAHTKRGMELMIFSRPGHKIEAAANPIHHHITILTANAAAYAKALHTNKFVIEFQRHAK